MPKFTIDLTAAAVTRVQALVARYNENAGAALTVAEWLLLHIKELAIQDELNARATVLQRQAQDDANAALLAEQTRLIASLGGQ